MLRTYTHCVPITPLKIGWVTQCCMAGRRFKENSVPFLTPLKSAPEFLMKIKFRTCPTNNCATKSVRVHGKKTFVKICASLLDVLIVLLHLYSLRQMTVKVKMSNDAAEEERENENQKEVYDYNDNSNER